MQLDATKNKLKQSWIICAHTSNAEAEAELQPPLPIKQKFEHELGALRVMFLSLLFSLSVEIWIKAEIYFGGVCYTRLYHLISFCADSRRKSPLMIAPYNKLNKINKDFYIEKT